MDKHCDKCGADLVGESTLSGMKIFACRSSGGPNGIAQSDICKGREPLYIRVIELEAKLKSIREILK